MSDANPGLMTIFADALEQPDLVARTAYLDRVCAGDASLRRRVEALLAAHDNVEVQVVERDTVSAGAERIPARACDCLAAGQHKRMKALPDIPRRLAAPIRDRQTDPRNQNRPQNRRTRCGNCDGAADKLTRHLQFDTFSASFPR